MSKNEPGMYRMKQSKDRGPLTVANAAIEIPPPANREHLTEPSWVENMIYLTGVLLEEAEVDVPDEESAPPKSEAA